MIGADFIIEKHSVLKACILNKQITVDKQHAAV